VGGAHPSSSLESSSATVGGAASTALRLPDAFDALAIVRTEPATFNCALSAPWSNAAATTSAMPTGTDDKGAPTATTGGGCAGTGGGNASATGMAPDNAPVVDASMGGAAATGATAGSGNAPAVGGTTCGNVSVVCEVSGNVPVVVASMDDATTGGGNASAVCDGNAASMDGATMGAAVGG
jgi:hypothetical protein